MNALLVGRIPAFYEAHLRAIIQRAISTSAAPAAASNHNKIKLLLRARHANLVKLLAQQLLASMLKPPNHHWSAPCLGNSDARTHARAATWHTARLQGAGGVPAKCEIHNNKPVEQIIMKYHCECTCLGSTILLLFKCGIA